jgi:hypothetical protein
VASVAVGNAIKNDFAADVILANVEFTSDARIYHEPGRAPAAKRYRPRAV